MTAKNCIQEVHSLYISSYIYIYILGILFGSELLLKNMGTANSLGALDFIVVWGCCSQFCEDEAKCKLSCDSTLWIGLFQNLKLDGKFGKILP